MSFDSPQSIIINNREYPVTTDTLTKQVNALATMMLVVDGYEARISALEAAKPSFSNPIRALDTDFVVDWVRDAYVVYTIESSVTVAITGSQYTQVDLNIDGNSNATIKHYLSMILGLLSLSVTQIHQKVLIGYVPAGSTVHMTTSGTGTATLIQCLEVLL